MPIKIKLTVCLIWMFLLLPISAWSSESYIGKVVQVYDGDTIKVQNETGEIRKVRLWGINAPEMRNPRAEECKRFVVTAALYRTVIVELKATDKYKRDVAIVWLDENKKINLNQEILWFGWAQWSKKYAPEALEFKEAQIQAKTGNRGVW